MLIAWQNIRKSGNPSKVIYRKLTKPNRSSEETILSIVAIRLAFFRKLQLGNQHEIQKITIQKFSLKIPPTDLCQLFDNSPKKGFHYQLFGT